MIKNRLTVRTVETKKTPGYYSDGGNLYLRITPNLTKSWAFIYRKANKRTEIGLGSISNVTLEQARDKADDLRKQIANGIEPLQERQRKDNERKAQNAKFMTFQQCAEAYINAHKAGWKTRNIFSNGK